MRNKPIFCGTFTNPAEANPVVMAFVNHCYPNHRIPVTDKHDETGPFLCMGNVLVMNIDHGEDYSTMLSDYATSERKSIGSVIFRSIKNAPRNEMFVDDEESGIYTKTAMRITEEQLVYVAKDGTMSDAERSLRMAFLGRVLRVMATPWLSVQRSSITDERIYLKIGMNEHIDRITKESIEHVLNQPADQTEFEIEYLF